MYREPFNGSSTNGVSTSTVPIFDSLGHPSPGAELAVSRVKSCSVQTFNPSAKDGLAVMPCGSVTTVFFTCDCARPAGLTSPSSCTFREKSRPVGLLAAFVVGCPAIVGLKPSFAQPVVPSGLEGTELSCDSI